MPKQAETLARSPGHVPRNSQEDGVSGTQGACRGGAPNTIKSELARRAPLEVSKEQIRMAVVEMKHEASTAL